MGAPTATSRRTKPESDQQRAYFRVVRHFRDRISELNTVIHVPNGGYRPDKTGLDLLLEGVEPGVPDVLVLRPLIIGECEIPTEGLVRYPACVRPVIEHAGLAIEFKAPGREREQAGGLSELQQAWVTVLSENSWKVVVAYNWWQAWEETMRYLRVVDLVPTREDWRLLAYKLELPLVPDFLRWLDGE